MHLFFFFKFQLGINTSFGDYKPLYKFVSTRFLVSVSFIPTFCVYSFASCIYYKLGMKSRITLFADSILAGRFLKIADCQMQYSLFFFQKRLFYINFVVLTSDNSACRDFNCTGFFISSTSVTMFLMSHRSKILHVNMKECKLLILS